MYPSKIVISALIAGMAGSACAGGFPGAFDAMGEARARLFAQTAPTSAEVEVGFSPEGGAQTLVLKAIVASKASIRLAAYSFTSPVVVKALLEAKRRGVDVAVLVDEKNNLREDHSGKARAALNLLVNAGIPTRTVSVFPIHHDKFIVVDGRHVETGSFNYSDAAARKNSENALVLWNDPAIAAKYLSHWQDRWARGVAYQSAY